MSLFVWIGLCFAVPLTLVGIATAVMTRLETARERRRHARMREVLGAPVRGTDLAGIVARSVVTLEGTLVGGEPNAGAGAAPLVSFHPYGTSFLDEPNVYAITSVPPYVPFALELDGGGRALLEGPMQVLVGSVESEHGAPLAEARAFQADDLASATIRTRVGQFRVVRVGDRVRALGSVDPAPDDDALYRARSRVFRMSPESAASPRDAIMVAVVEPPRRQRVAPRRGLRIVTASAVVAGAAMAMFAAQPRGPSRSPDAPAASGGGGAAAAPSSACRAGILAKLEANRLHAALELVRGCDDPYARALAMFAAGEFHEASLSFAEAAAKDPELGPSLSEAEAHLFARDFAAAARVVRRMSARFYPGPSSAEKRQLDCIGGLLDDRADQANGGSGPYIEKHPGKRYRKICSPRSFAKFARELDAEGGYWGDEDWMDFSARTYPLATAYDVVGNPFTAAVGTRARLLARPVGVERSLLDRLLVPPGPGRSDHAASPHGGRLDLFFGSENDYYPLVSTFAAELTLFYAWAGFPERSAPYWPVLDHVAEVAEATPERSFHVVTTTFDWDKKQVETERDLLTYVMSVAAASALHSGDAARARRYGALGEVHSAHVVRQLQATLVPGAPWEAPAEDGHWPDHQALFDAMVTGDGAAVAKVLAAQRSTGRDTLARIVPRLTHNRDALEAWFRDRFPAPCLTCGASELHGHLSDRREVARLLGDTRESDALRPAAGLFTDALTDVSTAFELDELETFFHSKR